MVSYMSESLGPRAGSRKHQWDFYKKFTGESIFKRKKSCLKSWRSKFKENLMTVWGEIKREREEGSRKRGTGGQWRRKKGQSALLQSFKTCILQEAFFTQTEKQLKKGEIQFYTEKYPTPNRSHLSYFSHRIGMYMFLGAAILPLPQRCLCGWWLPPSLLMCGHLAGFSHVPSSLLPDLHSTRSPSPLSAHRISWPSVSNYTFYWHFCCHIFLFRKAVTT